LAKLAQEKNHAHVSRTVLTAQLLLVLINHLHAVHQLLQQLHEPLGALAALQWGMGDRAAAAIGTHHRGASTHTRDSLAEAIFVAEQADHAMRKSTTFDVDLLWANGRLTGSPARAASALHQLLSAA
jgi:HD-like signal output (HDOD) protein